MSRFARCLFVMLPLLTALAAASAAAQDVRRYIYAAVPGVSNDEQFGGVGILVFDADNGHKFVRRIGIWETYRREAIEPIKGIAAHAATGRLYVSTTKGSREGTVLSATELRSPTMRKKSGLPTGPTTMHTSSMPLPCRLNTRKAFDCAPNLAGSPAASMDG